MKRRERSESFYIPSKRIEEYKRELIPINRVITTIDEDDEDKAIEIEKEEVDPEISMLAHMVGKELDNKEGCKRKKHKVGSSDEKDLAEEKDEFSEFGMDWQNNQVNETGTEEMVEIAGMELAGLSCCASSSVVDSK